MTKASGERRGAPNRGSRAWRADGGRLAGAAFLITGAIWLLSSTLLSVADTKGGEGAGDVSNARATLEEWVDTRRLISTEKRDWELAREMLNERIELVKRETESLRDRIEETESSIAEAEEKRAGLQQRNEKLKKLSDTLADTAIELERRTRGLLEQMPDRVREQVKPLSQRLPDEPENTEMALGERFQNIIGILNELNTFNSEVSVESEVRELEDGSAVEVDVLYVGIGQAFYVSGDREIAGIGTLTNEGWAWKQKDDAAPEIARAISILKNEEVASFVKLPIEIR